MIEIRKKIKEHPRLSYSLLGLGSFLIFLCLSFLIFINSPPGKLLLIFLNQPTTELSNSQGKTNLVILGLGGEGNNVQDLTDTIIFVSLDHSEEKTLMLSLPRDLWLESLKAKINTAYHYGGIDLVKISVEEVVGQEVHYVFLVDFEGFKKAINLLGGLKINIENSFDDYRYPIPGKENDPCDGDPEYQCRYEHIHYDAGWQVLDGERALKYVRSRNAEGDEGTDFSRAKRQQNLIMAFKDNLLTKDVLLSPQKLQGLWQIGQKSFSTDIKMEEYPLWAKLMMELQDGPIESQVLNGDHGLLYHPQIHYSGQWVLIPQDSSWQTVHQFIEDLIQSN